MASPWLTPSAQIRALAKAVSAAFAASNLPPEATAPGKIEITDLPWAWPPLVTSLMLGGVPLQDYLDTPIRLDETRLEDFWISTLHQLWFEPSRLMRRGTLTNCGWAMPKVSSGQRALRFAQPVGWPALVDELAGVMFTMELVHAASISLPYDELVRDSSNYWVRLGGLEIGVRDGRIIVPSPWTGDVSGQVLDLLEMTRGEADYRCAFDQIASVRSVLHVNRKSFPHNFEALDIALQALRILSAGAHCPALTDAMKVVPVDLTVEREKENALRESLDVMRAEMPDRDKLRVLHAALVPAVLTRMGFKRHIFAGQSYPFTLAAAKAEDIINWLEATYRRLPAELQQGGVCRT